MSTSNPSPPATNNLRHDYIAVQPHRRPPRRYLPPPKHPRRSWPRRHRSHRLPPRCSRPRLPPPPPPRPPAPLLGLLSFVSFYPTELPHSSAPFTQALKQAADFSFSFVPSAADRRFPLDACDGRVLLELDKDGVELAVSDPLFRRYTLLPETPREDHSTLPRRRYRRAFLIPRAGADEELEVDIRSNI